MVRIRINVISESVLTVRAHGIHSAFLENTKALETSTEATVEVNAPWLTDITHVHTVGPYGIAHLLASRRSVVTAHVLPDSLTGSFLGGRRFKYVSERYLAWYYNLADAVIALDGTSIKVLRSMGVNKTIALVPNMINVADARRCLIDRQDARVRVNLPARGFVVLAVGQFQPRKGVKTFFECAEACPDALFVWVGGNVLGPLAASRRQLKKMAANRPPNVLMAGLLARDRVFDYYSAADMFFLPSRHEICSMAVLEAAVSGLPILLRDLPQHRSLMGDACLYGDESSFAKLVQSVIADRALRSRLESASISVAKNRDSTTNVSGLLDVYRALGQLKHS